MALQLSWLKWMIMQFCHNFKFVIMYMVFSAKSFDLWHMTCDTWHVTFDMWYVTYDMWLVVRGEHSLKISAPYLLRLVIYDIMKIWRKRLTDWLTDSLNQPITKVLVEQPRLHRVCTNVCHISPIGLGNRL